MFSNLLIMDELFGIDSSKTLYTTVKKEGDSINVPNITATDITSGSVNSTNVVSTTITANGDVTVGGTATFNTSQVFHGNTSFDSTVAFTTTPNFSSNSINLNDAQITYNGSDIVNVNKIITASKVRNAVWNDIADALTVESDIELIPGKAYAYDGNNFRLTNSLGDSQYVGIHSDTAGYVLGADDNSKQLLVAIAGFVLAYVDKEYESGTLLTCTKDGFLTEVKNNERPVVSFFKKEEEEVYKNIINVNGRSWVKIL